MAENLKIPASVDLEIRQAEAKAKVLADKVSASFQKIKIGGFDSSGLKAGSAALGRIRQDADQFTKSMEAANARVLAFGTAVGVIEGMRRSFLALIKTTADVETALTKISIVAGSDLEKTGTTIEKVGKQIFAAAKQTGQTFQVTAEAYLELSRQGLGLSQSLERTKVSLDVVRASGAEHSKVISGLTAAYNAFSDTGLTYTQIAEKIANVDAKTTTSYEGLLDVLSRASSTARQTGTSFEELLAITSTLKDLTARSESVIGNAFRSISVRLLDPDRLKSIEALYGINTRDLDTNALLKPVEILTNVSEKLKEISDPSQRNEIIKSISGLYQADQLNALTKALGDANNIQGLYQKNLAASTEKSDVLARSSEKFSQTLNNQLATLDTQLGEFLNSLGKIGVKNPLSGLLDSFIDAGNFIQGIIDGTDEFSQIIQGIGRGIGGSLFSPAVFGAIAIAIGKIGVNFATFAVNAGKTFLGLNRASQEQAAIQKSIAAYIQQSGVNISSLLTSESARLNLAKQISAEWAKQAVYSKQVGGVAQVVAGSIYGSGLRVGESGPTLAKKGMRSAKGYLPDLVSGEMNDIRKGVGGASSNSKVVVMPNFPLGGGNRGLMVANSSESVVNLGGGKFGVLNQDMMGQRAASGFLSSSPVRRKNGQFVDKSSLETSLSLMIKAAILSGASSKELNNVIQSTIKNFELVRESFVRVSKEANVFGQNLLKQNKLAIASQKALIPGSVGKLNTGGTGFSSLPELSGLGFRRPAHEGPIQGDPFGISNVYTPEKLEQSRVGNVTRQRLKIDKEKERAQKEEIKRLTLAARSVYSDRSKNDVAIGEIKNKLKTETDSGERRKLITNLKLKSHSKRAFSWWISKYEKELFEKYGIDATKPYQKPLSQNQRVNNDALKESLRKRLEDRLGSGGGGGNPPRGGFTDFSKNGPLSPDGGLAPAMEKTKKSFIEVAGKLILLQAATDGIASAFGGTESNIGKFSQLLGQASLGLLAIGELSKINTSEFADTLKNSIEKAGEKIKNIGTSGTSDFARGARAGVAGEGSAADFAEFGDSKRKGVLSNSRSARIGRRFGGATAGVSKFISGAAGAASTAIGFLPIIGQVALGATILYQGLKIFKPDLFENLKVGLGGLTKEAEKSAQAFKDNAEFLFDATGNAVLRGLKDVQQGFQSALEVARREQTAKSKGIDTEGKDQKQISNELLGKRIDEILSKTKTGGKRESIVGSRVLSGSIGAVNAPIYGIIDETLGNIDSSITTVLKENLQLLSNQTEEGLREFLSSKGVSKINGEDIKNAGLDKLQDEVYKLFLENIVRNIEPIKRSIEVGRAKELTLALGEKFYELPQKTAAKPKLQTGGVNLLQKFVSPFYKATNGDPESIQKFLEVQKEIELLAFDASAANIESQIKSLESSLSSSTLSNVNKNDLENKIAGFQSFVLANSLAKLRAEAEVSIGKVNADKELSPLEKSGKIQQINAQLSVEETKIKSDIKSISDSTLARNKEFAAIQKLVPIIDAASSSISKLELDGVKNQANIDLLEAQSQNPALTTIQRENFQREINAKRQFDIQNQIEIARKSGQESEARLPLSENRDKLAQDIRDKTEQTVIALEGQAAALGIATSQIGQFGNAAQKFADSILEFERGLGESRAQNQFNLLQATDKSSIVSGLISDQSFDAVTGKSGTDLVSSLSEQNAIRQQQFDIATAASKVERLNLETELELNQEIFSIRSSDLSSAEKQLAIENAINANLEKRRTFGFGVRESLGGMRDEVNSFGSTFGKTATEGFRDGLVSAMQAAVSQTDNLKDALLDVALTFSNKLRDAALTNLANIITSGSRSGQSSGGGGIISSILGAFTGQRYASGGHVTGGSGTKDDVPTLLMGGEYVVNKKAVNTYGKSFFEALNNRSVGKMAQGGYFAPGVRGQGTIYGKDNLLDFATQTATFGGQDVRRSLIGGAGMVSLEPESLRLSNFNRFGDSPIVQATQDAKDQAFGLYTDQLGQEKQYQEELANYYQQLEEARAAQKKAEKDKKKQFLISLATAVVGAGISYGLGGRSSAGAKSSETKYNGGAVRNITERPFSPAKSSLPRTSYSSSSNLPSSIGSFDGIQPLGSPQFDWREMIRQINANIANKSFTNFDLGINRGSSLLLPPVGYTPYGRNSGGAISGSGDNVPIMASKGEFMLNSSATKKIGLSNLYAMNNGVAPSGEGDSSVIVAKLDELIEKTIGASNVTVNVTVSKDGEQSSSDNSGDQNNKQLAEKLRGAVIQIIQSEQRPGGTLSKR